jgi:hypothetical protein
VNQAFVYLLAIGFSGLALPRAAAENSQVGACPGPVLAAERSRLAAQEPAESDFDIDVSLSGTAFDITELPPSSLVDLQPPPLPVTSRQIRETLEGIRPGQEGELIQLVDRACERRGLSQPDREALRQSLRQRIEALASTPDLPFEGQDTLRQLRVRERLLEHADEPVEISESFDGRGKRVAERRHRVAAGPPPVPPLGGQMVEILPPARQFVAATDPRLNIADHVTQQRAGWRIAEPASGRPLDVHFTGGPQSTPNPVDRSRYRVRDYGRPFDPPEPLPVTRVRMNRGTPAQRLARVLHAGEHATQIAQGGGNSVYVTHPRLPAGLVGADREAVLQWVVTNRHRLIKVANGDETLPHMIRRDHAMRAVSRQIASRVTFDGKPLMYVVEKTDVRHIENGITIETFVEGKSAAEVQRMLDRYRARDCNAACRAVQVRAFERAGLLHPDEMAARLGALEQAYRDHYLPGMRFSRANRIQEVANMGRPDASGARPTIEVASDYNHGSNHIWDSRRQMWAEFDR